MRLKAKSNHNVPSYFSLRIPSYFCHQKNRLSTWSSISHSARSKSSEYSFYKFSGRFCSLPMLVIVCPVWLKRPNIEHSSNRIAIYWISKSFRIHQARNANIIIIAITATNAAPAVSHGDQIKVWDFLRVIWDFEDVITGAVLIELFWMSWHVENMTWYWRWKLMRTIANGSEHVIRSSGLSFKMVGQLKHRNRVASILSLSFSDILCRVFASVHSFTEISCFRK